MLFGETVAVYCENHTEHTDTVRTSEEIRYVSTTEPNWLMLFGETHRYSPYLTENTLHICYRAQPVNAVWENKQIQSVPHRKHITSLLLSQTG
jgi:hypothetical protein